MAVKRFVPLVLYSAIFLFYFFSLRSMKENSKAIRSDPEKSARMPQGYRNMKIYENRFFTGWTFVSLQLCINASILFKWQHFFELAMLRVELIHPPIIRGGVIVYFLKLHKNKIPLLWKYKKKKNKSCLE